MQQPHRSSHTLSRQLVYGVAILIGIIGTAELVSAQEMPWDSVLESLLSSVLKVILPVIGTIAVIVAGLSFATGTDGQFLRTALSVIFGLAIAFSASTIIGLFGG